MKRVLTLLTVIALTPLIMGGGSAPPPLFNSKITGPAISAVVVMDPHQFGVTTTAKQASIWLMKGTLTAGAVLNIPSTFGLFLGCDPSPATMSARFVATPQHDGALQNWIPSPKVSALFTQLGIPIGPMNLPVITDVNNVLCMPDPSNPSPSGTLPGLLSFTAVVQFQVPQ